MTTITRRWTTRSAVVLSVCALAACGSDDGGGSDTEAFCEQVRVLNEADDETQDDIGAAADEFAALIDDAPDDIKDDLRILVDAFGELDAIDEDDPDAFALLFEIFERPEVLEATETLEAFGVEECGLDPSTEQGDEDGSFDETSDPAATSDDGGIDVAEGGEAADGGDVADGDVKTTTVPGDPYDEEFWGPIDPDEVSIPGLKQHLDVNYAAEGWFDGAISGWGTSGTEIRVNADVDPDEAVRICDAVLEYAGPLSPDVDVRVDDPGSEPLAVGSVADGCTTA